MQTECKRNHESACAKTKTLPRISEEDGDALGELSRWLESFAPGRQVVRRLLFKVLTVENYRPRESGPVLLQ